MGAYANAFGPHAPEATYVDHGHEERLLDTGEVELNYVVDGDPASPPLLLIPGQTESWWGYAKVIPILAERFRVHAVARSVDPHARAIHAESHGQRPRSLHRRRHRRSYLRLGVVFWWRVV
ncbi:MAG: alpha/beta fold hydrolase, partial [Acidimicrobiales bacterium]